MPDASSVLSIGGGRGFAVSYRNYLGHEEPIVITAAHCLGPELPPPHPARLLDEETFQLLAPLGSEPTVWARCHGRCRAR